MLLFYCLFLIIDHFIAIISHPQLMIQEIASCIIMSSKLYMAMSFLFYYYNPFIALSTNIHDFCIDKYIYSNVLHFSICSFIVPKKKPEIIKIRPCVLFTNTGKNDAICMTSVHSVMQCIKPFKLRPLFTEFHAACHNKNEVHTIFLSYHASASCSCIMLTDM